MEKVYTKEEENKIQWHQAFVGAMYCEKVYEKWCSGRVVQQYRENERKDRDITVMLVKQRYPLSLVRYLESRGCVITEKLPGISTVSGSQFFNIVIFTTRRMSSENNMWLNVLCRNMERENYGRLARESSREYSRLRLEC